MPVLGAAALGVFTSDCHHTVFQFARMRVSFTGVYTIVPSQVGYDPRGQQSMRRRLASGVASAAPVGSLLFDRYDLFVDAAFASRVTDRDNYGYGRNPLATREICLMNYERFVAVASGTQFGR